MTFREQIAFVVETLLLLVVFSPPLFLLADWLRYGV